MELRCSLDTAPSHPRNVAFRDYLGKLEEASGGQIKTKLFESGSLFPDLQVTKALVQGQVEMACPGTWTIPASSPMPTSRSFPRCTVGRSTWCTGPPMAPAAKSSTPRSPAN